MAKSKTPQPAGVGAGLKDYFKAAFLFKWNLLFFASGIAAGMISPMPSVMLPVIAAGELAYLTALTSIPRFRAAIDAKVHSEQSGQPGSASPPPIPLVSMLAGLPTPSRTRFERLRARCLEMRRIAAGVRGATGAQTISADHVQAPGLDRLLWLFLRLLLSKTALDKFLESMNEQEISAKLAETRANLATAQAANDERIVRSLQDSVAMGELRLDNYSRAKKNAEFVTVELDRIEGKIQALAEMAVNRQDPDFLTDQVDSAAESMRQTEKAVSELQHLTGLADALEEPPAILESDLREVLRQ